MPRQNPPGVVHFEIDGSLLSSRSSGTKSRRWLTNPFPSFLPEFAPAGLRLKNPIAAADADASADSAGLIFVSLHAEGNPRHKKERNCQGLARPRPNPLARSLTD